jgi:hypothetical protein
VLDDLLCAISCAIWSSDNTARQGLMLGIRQPLDGPVFEKLEDARNWCIYAMIDHYDRRLGMSDARIESFKGMVDCGPPPDPALVRDIARICETIEQEKDKLR